MSYKAKTNYANGRRFFNFQKELDHRHRIIDARAERNEADTNNLNPVEVNETGRVWSFA